MHAEQIIKKLSPLLEPLSQENSVHNCPVFPSSAQAAISITLNAVHQKTILWITDGPQSLETAHRDLLALRSEEVHPLLYFPQQETISGKDLKPDPDITGHRLTTLLALNHTRTRDRTRINPHIAILDNDIKYDHGYDETYIITTCIQALMQKTLSPAQLRNQTLTISVGSEHKMNKITNHLSTAQYEFTPEVFQKGDAAVRGGILDIWPFTETWPVRLEFFGSTIDSIRTFNPADQKSIKKIDVVTIPPLSTGTDMSSSSGASLLNYLPPETIITWADVDSIAGHASSFLEVMIESKLNDCVLSLKKIQNSINRRKKTRQLIFSDQVETNDLTESLDIVPLQGTFALPRELLEPDMMEQVRGNLLADLLDRARKKQSVLMFFDTQGGLDHFRKTSGKRGKTAGISLLTGSLSAGFVCESAGLIVVAESDLFGQRKSSVFHYDPQASKPRPEKTAGARIESLADMEPGDLVVHIDHGIGKYLGLYEIAVSEKPQEVITLEYADGAKLHIPTTQAHLLSRYVGIARRQVPLHKIGGNRWTKEKINAEYSIVDLASSLLETHAERSLLKGSPFPQHVPWQHEFETSFPYRETPDQLKVFSNVEEDLVSARPMDRLVCGDAGYGKTEVAIRAAFKAVMSEKQVAVLVPTTVLAQQHFDTFSERMTPYPVRVDMLSRFCSRKQKEETLSGIKDGTVDIVIGTHALLQPGVHFKDLGLVVIDEEQRFGVKHKERLKQMRKLVDILTLTATPIPRTLYMSMTGARDMSLLQSPPSERMAIETIVSRSSDNVIRNAILREINREGQVFYLHNRILTIERVRKHLEKLVPEARIRTAHGRMASGELSSVMHDFSEGNFDVLLCTTIIESGLDIPRANTILIDRADRFGIADLYQLRGRVGRSSHKAYAYLLLPNEARIDSDAKARIGAVKKYSGLSAGFNLALRDLEIRGAGNLLGAAQSGHITAIGFGLYCQLLKRTVARLKGEKVPPVIDTELKLDFINLSPSGPENSSAMIPYYYIEDESMRVNAYRRIAETASTADADSLALEFIDRFGALPPQVQRLIKAACLRIEAMNHGITRIETKDRKIIITQGNEYVMTGNRFPRLTSDSSDGMLDEILALIRK